VVRRVAASAVVTAMCLPAPGLARSEPPALTGAIELASEATSKGLGKSDGAPQAAVRLETEAQGLTWGAWIGNIVTSEGADAEAHLYVRLDREIGAARVALTAFHKSFPGTRPGVQDAHSEFQVDLRHSAGPVTLRHRLEYAPDGYSGVRQAWWAETAATIDVAPRLAASAAVGRRKQVGSADYAAWNAGLEYELTDAVALGLRYFETDAHDLGERYGPRLVVSATIGF
jgi:hypothetical protein